MSNYLLLPDAIGASPPTTWSGFSMRRGVGLLAVLFLGAFALLKQPQQRFNFAKRASSPSASDAVPPPFSSLQGSSRFLIRPGAPGLPVLPPPRGASCLFIYGPIAQFLLTLSLPASESERSAWLYGVKQLTGSATKDWAMPTGKEGDVLSGTVRCWRTSGTFASVLDLLDEQFMDEKTEARRAVVNAVDRQLEQVRAVWYYLPDPPENLPSFPAASGAGWPVCGKRNGLTPVFPWRFEGRCWFRPAIVRAPPPGSLPKGARALSLFGWTVGGLVALQYDVSPVGPYLEYVRMGALVTKRGALGQWGSALYVSTEDARAVCEDVWGVPALAANISFEPTGDALCCAQAPPVATTAATEATKPVVCVRGWQLAKHAKENAPVVGRLPVLWTPEIKALWAPLVPLPPPKEGRDVPLALHRLRLSAKSLRLHLCGQKGSRDLGLPLPVGLSADGLRIEIAEAEEEL